MVAFSLHWVDGGEGWSFSLCTSIMGDLDEQGIKSSPQNAKLGVDDTSE